MKLTKCIIFRMGTETSEMLINVEYLGLLKNVDVLERIGVSEAGHFKPCSLNKYPTSYNS